jgi:hypothetical protein
VKVWSDYPEIYGKIKEIDPSFNDNLVLIADKDLINK